jgi:hypothetical protein
MVNNDDGEIRHWFWFMAINTTFNNLSYIIWSVLLVEETEYPEKTTNL